MLRLRFNVANLMAWRQLLLYTALPLAYIVTGRLGIFLAAPPGYATAVFVPAGIAVTATFVVGAAALPGTFLGSFLLNLWIGYLIAGRLNLTQITAAHDASRHRRNCVALGDRLSGAFRQRKGYSRLPCARADLLSDERHHIAWRSVDARSSRIA